MGSQNSAQNSQKLDGNIDSVEIPESAKKLTNSVLLLLQDTLQISDEQLLQIDKKCSSTKETVTKILKERKLLNDPKIAIKLFGTDVFEYYSLFNKSVFNYKNVLLAGLKNDVDVYKISTFSVPINKLLHKDFEENKILADIILKKHVKSATKFSDIQAFIKLIAGENSETEKSLMKMYEKHLRMSHKLNTKDIKNKALLLSLNPHFAKVFSLFVNSKILNNKSEIDKNTSQIWSNEISESFSSKQLDSNKKNILNFLFEKLGLSTDEQNNPDVLSLIEAIYSVLQINIISKESTIDVDANNDNSTLERDHNDGGIDDPLNEKLSYCEDDCLCSYSYTSGGDYIIETEGSKISLSKEEFNQFSPDSLENYIKLYDVVSACGLAFILENKYKSGFFLLMQSRHTGFSPKGGRGFTKSLRLDVLNVLANMIGVPKNLYGEGSNTGEFPDITTAIDALKAIYYLGDINGENITKAGGGFIDNSAAEVKMQEIGILGKNGGFSLTKAQDILKQGGYIQEAANDRLYDENMTDINQFRTNNQNNNFTQEHSSNVEEIIGNNKKKSDQDNVLPFTGKTEPNINIADDLLEEKKAE